MKKLVLISFVLLSVFGVSAQNVSNSIAKTAAESFWTKSLKNINTTTQLQYCLTDIADTLLFVYNIDNSGFVVVAGDMSCTPILGYSTEGTFKNDMAPACKAWLQNYSGYIAMQKKLANKTLNPEWNLLLTSNNLLNNKQTTKSVLPLLTTKWDQGKWYNYYCPAYPTGPDGKCYTGCVATSMAQIMKYYNYPDKGIGSHSYVHPHFGTLSADFSATTFDWASMTNSASNLNKEAIGTLMYQCGVSVDMDYSPTGSGSQSEYAATSLKNYFHYRNTIAVVNKTDISLYDWVALLKDNLDQNHPVLYSGSEASGAGHAWVCDGYDANDKFHMNWGWSGANNAYFQVDTTSLNSGNGDFLLNQSAIVNIMPYFAPYCMTSRTFTDSTRVISDGSGYSYYWNNTNCDWLIKPTNAEKVRLQFADFNTESDNDVVSVYDGETTAGILLGTFSGSDTPDTILTANSGKMLITFSTNDTTQGLGWTAKYWCLKHGDGIQEDDYGKVAVYPNPVTDKLTIVNQVTINETVAVTLYDYSGKEVYSTTNTLKNGNTTQIDVSNLEAGFYIVSVQSAQHNYRTKFIKE